MTNDTKAPERRPVTKHDVIKVHLQHPDWTAPMIAKFLGCTPSYIHATAKRNGFTLKSARNKGLIPTLKAEISTLRSDLEAAQARIAELEEGLREQIFFHAMTLSLRREYMEPEEIKDVEFRRDRARATLEGEGW